MTVEALKLFLKSLPPGCMFDIISYGTKFESMSKTGVLYNETSKNQALEYVSSITANMGGNSEKFPLEFAY